ncbi:MAG: LacI family DNA-binding transcriptional regulator [Propionibacteriaceae bacterium]|nr:LacI family DNA-binding transcriptional regulator [Propionibacteriaceae bacterium]
MSTIESSRPLGRRARLVDVAEATGVHVSTVSRALSPDPEVAATVRARRREEIRLAAARLGYQPNAAGRNLRRGASRMIGLLVPRVTDTVLSSFYDGMLDAADAAGYTVVVVNTHDDPTRRRANIEHLIRQGVDAVIYTDAHRGEDEDLVSWPVPVMSAYRYHHQPQGVIVDDIEGGSLVADHLVELGHRHVGVLAGLSYATTTGDRTQGFLDRFSQLTGGCGKSLAVTSSLEVGHGRRVAEQLLSTGQPPTALFAVDDYLAVGAMSAIRQTGLQIGSDIAVVGYNDLPLARELLVPLTTVRVPLREIGSSAFASALAVLRGSKALEERAAPTLQVRASSGPARDAGDAAQATPH